MKRPGSRPALLDDDGVERPYDPRLDEDVPASWLGPALPDPNDDGAVPPLNPVKDLPRAAARVRGDE